MVNRDSLTQDFDYGELARLPEYQQLCHMISDLANQTPEEMEFRSFLKFMECLVAIAPFADNCEKCAFNGDWDDRETWPHSGVRKGHMLRGNYQCKRGHRWQCSYSITDWLTPDEIKARLRVEAMRSVKQEPTDVQVPVPLSPVSAPRGSTSSRTIPQPVKIAVAVRDQGQCVYCGSTERLQYDHIIPWSKGGDSSIDNIQLLCGSHNASKRDKIIKQEEG